MSRPVHLVAAVLGALVLTACGATPPPAEVGHSRFSPYVALGDSYTAAPLVPSSQSNDGCYRSTHNYPSLVADTLHIADFTDRSCGGAQTKDMTTSQLSGVGPQFAALDEDTRLVTLGIGGNDLGIAATLLTACPSVARQAPHGAPCRAAMQQHGKDRLLSAMPTVTTRIVSVLRGIHRRSPRARVLVVGYPQIVPAHGSCPGLPVAAGDYPYVREVNAALNTAVRSAARRTGDTFIDIWSASAGHDVCAADPWINDVHTKLDRAAALHPFAAEQQAVATLVVSALR